MIKVNTENPIEHWKYINVKNKIVLDLGCGRWEKIERRDPEWFTTPEYFISMGASKVFAIDINQEEIDWFNNNFKQTPQYEFSCRAINSIDTVEAIIRDTNRTVSSAT